MRVAVGDDFSTVQLDFPFCLPLTNIRAGCQSEIAHVMASRRFAVLGVTLNIDLFPLY